MKVIMALYFGLSVILGNNFDEYLMKQLHRELMEKYMCTLPFILKHIRENVAICSDVEITKKAINLYEDSPISKSTLWAENTFLMPPCAYHTYDAKETMSGDSTEKGLLIRLLPKMTVSEQYWSYDFMTYIAENGGFVGLFLGYSVLHLRDLIEYLVKKVNFYLQFYIGVIQVNPQF